jgi:hypothetical protein
MRLVISASVLSILALGTMVALGGPATAAKSKMGCNVGSQHWDATQGKCVAGAAKHKRMAKASGKKAPAKKSP